MIEFLIGLLTALIGAVFVLLKHNDKLKSDKKLNDVKVEDAKLETKQEAIQEKKKELKTQLKELDNAPKEDLSDEEIENFWKGYKK
jgi:septal ring factor EnvC (AmiA/AmiB activator)